MKHNIYICGGSAVGKTTFSEKLSKELDIPLIEEVIRQPPEWFYEYSLIHRETMFLLAQMQSELKEGNFIFDRCIVDVVGWMVDRKEDPVLYRYINENYIDSEGIYIITPPEDMKFILSHIDDYYTDPIRVKALSDKLGFKIDRDERAFAKTYEAFARWEREMMLKVIVGKVRPYLVYSSFNSRDLDDYKWQEEAEKLIWGVLQK